MLYFPVYPHPSIATSLSPTASLSPKIRTFFSFSAHNHKSALFLYEILLNRKYSVNYWLIICIADYGFTSCVNTIITGFICYILLDSVIAQIAIFMSIHFFYKVADFASCNAFAIQLNSRCFKIIWMVTMR